MTKDEVDAVRVRSRASSSGPWVTDYDEMAKKGLALDTPIPTPTGWTTMGDLKVGDEVIDMDGIPTRVIAVSEVKHLPCYRLTMANGDQVTCDDEHRWFATTSQRDYRAKGQHGWPAHTVNELWAAKSEGRAVTVPVAGPLQTGYVDLPVEPWTLGYWLGNGRSDGGNVTCHADDRDAVLARMEGAGYDIGAVRADPRARAVSVGVYDLKVALREAGVLGDKHIPQGCLRASVDQRMALLQGLMDSDGHLDKARGRASFGSTSERLADGVYELAVSLGQVVHRGDRIASGYGKQVRFYTLGWCPTFNPCTLPRKAQNFRERKFGPYRGVLSVEKVPSVPTRCIAVDSPTKSYLCGRSMVPTHNTVFRRAAKWLPISGEAAAVADEVERRAEEPERYMRVVQAEAPALPSLPGASRATAPAPKPVTPAAAVDDEIPMGPVTVAAEAVAAEPVDPAGVAPAEVPPDASAVQRLAALAKQDGILEAEVSAWMQTRKLDPQLDADAIKVVNAWQTAKGLILAGRTARG